MPMAFDTGFALLMLAVVASWIAAVVVVLVLLGSFLHATDGDGKDPVHGIRAAGSASWWAPPLIAVVLAAISLPLVALSLSIFDTSQVVSASPSFLPGSDPRRWTTAAAAVLISALVAGTIGAPAVRRRLVTGALFTFLLALITAIVVFPIAPARLGDPVGEVVLCIDGCSAIVDSSDPASGLHAAPFFAWAAFCEPAAVAALAVGVSLWSLVTRRLTKAASQAAR
jgi:hypothetical protein